MNFSILVEEALFALRSGKREPAQFVAIRRLVNEDALGQSERTGALSAFIEEHEWLPLLSRTV